MSGFFRFVWIVFGPVVRERGVTWSVETHSNFFYFGLRYLNGPGETKKRGIDDNGAPTEYACAKLTFRYTPKGEL